MGDTEFIAAMHHIVTPIARQFGPDMVSVCCTIQTRSDSLQLMLNHLSQIFVSAGFDAAEGHPANVCYIITCYTKSNAYHSSWEDIT